MGSYARMLVALCAALLLSLSIAATSLAATAIVRVEGRQIPSSTLPPALVERQRVTLPDAPITKVVDATTTKTCPADSYAAALTAAVGDNGWRAAVDGSGNLVAASIKNVTAPAGAGWVGWSNGGNPQVDDLCTTTVPSYGEALFFPKCTSAPADPGGATCFSRSPLYPWIKAGTLTPYEVDPILVVDNMAPVEVYVFANGTQALDATVNTDEDYPVTAHADNGQAFVSLGFATQGPHVIVATSPGMVPGRLAVCATDAGGTCGTTKVEPPPFVPPDTPCATNGHDGQCGTEDTTGPPTTIMNIADGAVYKHSSAPTQVKGTIGEDRNGVKDVQVRLTRVTTKRVKVKPKKKHHKKKAHRKAKKSTASAAKKHTKHHKKKRRVRYRRVKVCQTWNNATLLFRKMKRCGAQNGLWTDATLSDVPTDFSYGFEMKLPKGKYTLETLAHDVNGYAEDVELGRNVITFTVR
ncbi:MAG TPA: hypothetical protein VFT50_07620 [Baekduia sp.]|nr:hypothetical protein [Baekduia sp.]